MPSRSWSVWAYAPEQPIGPGAQNLTTDDERLYTHLARDCKERGLIEGNDRYVWVKITDAGERYLGV